MANSDLACSKIIEATSRGAHFRPTTFGISAIRPTICARLSRLVQKVL